RNRCYDAALDEVNEVGVAEPGRQHTPVDWLRKAGADPDRDALDPVFVPVELSEALAKHFRDAIDAIGTRQHCAVDQSGARMHADGMIRTPPDDAAHLVFARSLVEVVEAVNVAVH